MTSGVYIRSKEAIEKNRIGHIGIIRTEASKKKQGDAIRGRKGHIHTPEERKHHSQVMKGRPSHRKGSRQTDESNRKNREHNLGKHKHSPEFIEKQRERNAGSKNFFYGKQFFGEKNHNWKGGISFEPYSREWTRQLKQYIRYRDDNICQLNTEHKQKKELFSVHHIDYNKMNCKEDNLITLCRSCHAKTNNGDRNKWTRMFKDKLKMRGIHDDTNC